MNEINHTYKDKPIAQASKVQLKDGRLSYRIDYVPGISLKTIARITNALRNNGVEVTPI